MRKIISSILVFGISQAVNAASTKSREEGKSVDPKRAVEESVRGQSRTKVRGERENTLKEDVTLNLFGKVEGPQGSVAVKLNKYLELKEQSSDPVKKILELAERFVEGKSSDAPEVMVASNLVHEIVEMSGNTGRTNERVFFEVLLGKFVSGGNFNEAVKMTEAKLKTKLENLNLKTEFKNVETFREILEKNECRKLT